MSRLRNRIRKADYFSDGELLRWPRDKRATYSGLWAIAEDSGCLEDDCFEWKMALWPSPLDADITVDMLEQWRDEMIVAGKLIPYEADGKRYLFIRTFHQHEHPTNPQKPDLPLPPWVTAEVTEGRAKDGKKWSRCSFAVSTESFPPRDGLCTESVQTQHARISRSPVLSSPVQTGPEVKPIVESASDSTACEQDFCTWWAAYGKVGHVAEARPLYVHWRGAGATADELLTAATRYRSHCAATGCKMQHARTFLAKKPCRWREWADGEPHGSMDVSGAGHLSDVLAAGGLTFGLNGGRYARSGDTRRPAGSLGRGADAGRGLPAGELDPGE